MQKIRSLLDRPFEKNGVMFLGGIGFTIAWYATVAAFGSGTYLFDLYYARGPFQVVSTVLFGYAFLVLVGAKLRLGEEVRALVFALPERRITPSEAIEFAEQVPLVQQRHILGRRIAALLRGFGRGEAIGPLVERLREQDRDQLHERNHAPLDPVRAALPLVGLIGTVWGLSRGMIQFVGFTEGAASIDGLREVLRQFGSSLGVAFDATLLSLVYMLFIVLAAEAIRRSEDSLLTMVDGMTAAFTAQLHHALDPEPELGQMGERLAGAFADSVDRHLAGAIPAVVSAFRSSLESSTALVARELASVAEVEARQLAAAAQAEIARIAQEVPHLFLESPTLRDSLAALGAIEQQVGGASGTLQRIEATLARPRPPLELRILATDQWVEEPNGVKAR